MSRINILTGDIVAIQVTIGAICGLIYDIETLWGQIYKDHKDAVRRLVNRGDNIHVEFYRCMEHIRNQCHQSCNTLDDIKAEFLTARRDRVLDPIVANEIKEESTKILREFEASDERSNAIVQRMYTCQNKIMREERRLFHRGIYPSFVSTLDKMARQTATLTLCTAAGVATMPVEKVKVGTLLNVAGGALTAAAISQVIEYCRANQLNPMVQDLNTLNDRMNALFQHMAEFRSAVRERMVEIRDYVQRVENGQEDAIHQLGDELVDKVNVMVEKTNTLHDSLLQLEERAADSADFIRNIIRLEHPRALRDI